MPLRSNNTLLTLFLLFVVGCSVLVVGVTGGAAQEEPSTNYTYDSIEEARDAATFQFNTPSYIPSGVPFNNAMVMTEGDPPIVRLFWNTEDRDTRLALHIYPRPAPYPKFNLFAGNAERENVENITINGQPGDFQRPRTPSGSPSVTFVSDNNTVYSVVGTYNRSTLIRVAESIGEDSQSQSQSQPQSSQTVTIVSTDDERVFYNITVSESIEPGSGADLTGAEFPDTVGETTASGSTAQGGIDNFTYSGEITALDLRGGPANVLVNGKQVDPDSFASPSTPTPTVTPSPTPTARPTPTPTPTATPTPTPTATATPTPSPTATPPPTSAPRVTSTSQLTPRSPSTSVPDATTASSPGSLSPRSTASGGRLLTGTPDENSGGQSTGFGAGFGIPVAVVVVLATGFLLSRRVV